MLIVRLLCFFLNIFHCHLKLKFKVQNHLLKKQIEYFTIKNGNIMVQIRTKNVAMHALKSLFLIVMGINGFFGSLKSNFNNSPNITLNMCWKAIARKVFTMINETTLSFIIHRISCHIYLCFIHGFIPLYIYCTYIFSLGDLFSQEFEFYLWQA
jgi:hypothetical protein